MEIVSALEIDPAELPAVDLPDGWTENFCNQCFSPGSGAVNAAGRDNIDLAHHLTGVSCTSDTSCVAVDDHGQEVAFDPSTGRVLGGGPTSIDGTTPLTAVSCPDGGDCTAVDNGGNELVGGTASGTIVHSGGLELASEPLSKGARRRATQESALVVNAVFSLREHVERQVLRRTGRRVRNLEVELCPERIVLRGLAATYHVKQLAQHSVLDLLPTVHLENAIVVERSLN